jgi:hypothetical protein
MDEVSGFRNQVSGALLHALYSVAAMHNYRYRTRRVEPLNVAAPVSFVSPLATLDLLGTWRSTTCLRVLLKSQPPTGSS